MMVAGLIDKKLNSKHLKIFSPSKPSIGRRLKTPKASDTSPKRSMAGLVPRLAISEERRLKSGPPKAMEASDKYEEPSLLPPREKPHARILKLFSLLLLISENK